jgi:hypothetical protein
MVKCKTREKVIMACDQGSIMKFAWKMKKLSTIYQNGLLWLGYQSAIKYIIMVLTFWKHSTATQNILEVRTIHFVYWCEREEDQIVNNTVVKLGLYPHIHRVLQRRWRLQ